LNPSTQKYNLVQHLLVFLRFK